VQTDRAAYALALALTRNMDKDLATKAQGFCWHGGTGKARKAAEYKQNKKYLIMLTICYLL